MNRTVTENGAKAYQSTKESILDFFRNGSLARKMSFDEVKHMFLKAYNEDKELALKALFYVRDIRGGVGERETFRRCISVIPQEDMQNIEIGSLILEYGRFDDLVTLLDSNKHQEYAMTEIVNIINSVTNKDFYAYYVYKWLPSVNTSSKKSVARAKKIASALKMTHKQYRKWLSKNRLETKVFESLLTKHGFTGLKDSDFDFSKLPSRCLNKYKNSFATRIEKEYKEFLAKAETGEVKVNSKDLFLYEIVKNIFHHQAETSRLGAVQWDNLPNYLEGFNEGNVLCVSDISSSMTWDENVSMYNSIGLATYFAQRNTGIYKDKYIAFSDNPMLIDLKEVTPNQDIKSILNGIMNKVVGNIYSTNLQTVFEVVYKTVKAKLEYGNFSKEDIPMALLIITDGQFNAIGGSADSKTLVQKYKLKFIELSKKHNTQVDFPNVVFWNVRQQDKTNTNFEATAHESGIQLYGGYSQAIFKQIMQNLGTTPYLAMLKTLNSERYANVKFKG